MPQISAANTSVTRVSSFENGRNQKIISSCQGHSNFRKLLRGIYRTGLTWKDQNLGREVEVIYMDEPCNASHIVTLHQDIPFGPW